jgi:hypothetical protein
MGGSMLLWCCLAEKRIGYITQALGGLDLKLHCKIMTENRLPSLQKYDMTKDDAIFQHDNRPKHTFSLT